MKNIIEKRQKIVKFFLTFFSLCFCLDVLGKSTYNAYFRIHQKIATSL